MPNLEMRMKATESTKRQRGHRCSWISASLFALTFAFTQQSPGQIVSSQGKTILIPAGTTLEGRIDTKIGSAFSRAGQKFNVTLASPVLGNGQAVLIPAGSQLTGEVVEAIPSGHLEHAKKTPKPMGKLRVQLTGLRTPDGTTYPLVASFIGEVPKKNPSAGGRTTGPELGTGVAYIGSQSNFNRIYPAAGGRSGPLVTKQQMLNNPLYGDPEHGAGLGGGIRSLLKRGRELIIYQGSPMSVRLDAPLEMAVVPVPSETFPLSSPAPDREGKRFSQGDGAESAPMTNGSGPSFLDGVDGLPNHAPPLTGSAPVPSAPLVPAASAQSAPAVNAAPAPNMVPSFQVSPATEILRPTIKRDSDIPPQ